MSLLTLYVGCWLFRKSSLACHFPLLRQLWLSHSVLELFVMLVCCPKHNLCQNWRLGRAIIMKLSGLRIIARIRSVHHLWMICDAYSQKSGISIIATPGAGICRSFRWRYRLKIECRYWYPRRISDQQLIGWFTVSLSLSTCQSKLISSALISASVGSESYILP